jgi:outer membrane lipoprotein-sorting protein
MTKLRRLPMARWLIPVLAAVVFIGGGSAVAAIAASSHRAPAPPPVPTLLADVSQAHVRGLSGTIVQDSNLGIPEVPGMGGGSSSNLSSLVSGSHTLRVWYAGARHVRLSLLGQMGESDVIRNGNDLWIWSSSTKTASHRVLPARTATRHELQRHPMARPDAGMRALTPQGAARMLLRKAGPSTRITHGANTVVADRPAWQLVVTPRTDRTLVGSVRIAVDTATHLPLRVQVFARGSHNPAFDVGYTAFDPTTPSMSVFRFNPPAGTKVTNGSGALLGGMTEHHAMPRTHAMPRMHAGGTMAAQPPKVVGSGWTSVVVAHVPAGALQQATGQLGAMLQELPKVSGSWGSGRLLQGTLFSALVTNDGRVAVGAVPPAQLYAALEAR